MKAVVPVGQRVRFSTLEIIRNWLVAFTRGFADSLRGAIELFLLDYRYSTSTLFGGTKFFPFLYDPFLSPWIGHVLLIIKPLMLYSNIV